jgi:hypothetical protein
MAEWITTCPTPQRWERRLRAHFTETGADDCWDWRGKFDRNGYGRFDFKVDGRSRTTGAHRAAWLTFVGDIPGRLVIDHLCRNQRCVNTAHMELVTSAENTRRGEQAREGARAPRVFRAGEWTAIGGSALDGVQLRKPDELLAYHRGCPRHGREDGREYEPPGQRRRWECRI